MTVSGQSHSVSTAAHQRAPIPALTEWLCLDLGVGVSLCCSCLRIAWWWWWAAAAPAEPPAKAEAANQQGPLPPAMPQRRCEPGSMPGGQSCRAHRGAKRKEEATPTVRHDEGGAAVSQVWARAGPKAFLLAVRSRFILRPSVMSSLREHSPTQAAARGERERGREGERVPCTRSRTQKARQKDRKKGNWCALLFPP